MAAITFSGFWFLSGELPAWHDFWQPLVIAILYIAGQCGILAAVSLGDVSVATPIASSKVIIVSLLLVLFGIEIPTLATWLAAILATVGVVMINFVVPSTGRKRVFLTVGLALAGASCFAVFDICVQTWSPQWGTGRIVPVTYWMVGLLSLGLLPWVDSPRKAAAQGMAWKSLWVGSALVAIQAMFLVYAIAQHGDAARLNVVYSLRGLWGVLFAWMLASWFGGAEKNTPTTIMLARLGGAILLVAAVAFTVLEVHQSG